MKWKLLILITTLFTLVACGSGGSDPKTVTKPLSTNTKPIAVITTEQSEFKVNTTLVFSAAQSSDPDGDALSYQWQLTSKNEQVEIPITVNNESTVEFSVSEAQEYQLVLTVSDGKLSSTPAQKQLTVTANTQLIANAGSTQTVKQGDVVLLNGAQSSTTSGAINQYKWQFITKPVASNATLENATQVKSQFVADEIGEFKVELTVTNSQGDTASTVVLIKSESLNSNSSPQAVINVENKTIAPNEVVTLYGNQSTDPDKNDTLSYAWAITSKPEGSTPALSNMQNHTAGFSASTAGDYSLSLTVTDQQNKSDTASVTLTVTTSNKAPVATLESERDITLNESTTLQCQQCSDPDGDTLSYNWQLQAKPVNSASQLTNSTSATPSIVADKEGDYVVVLTVSDGQLSSNQATSALHASSNKKPITLVTYETSITVDEQVLLDASTSYDPEGQPLSYQWEIISSQGQATLSSNTISKPTFSASVEGQVVISLRTNDGVQFSDTKTLTIDVIQNALPVISFTGEQSRYDVVGNAVKFDVSQSYDPEGTTLDYAWTLSAPSGSSTSLSNANQSITEFIADMTGSYTLTVVATDADGFSKSVQFSITVTNSALLTGRIKGQLTNVQKAAISNAQLTINGLQYTTNTNGFFDEEVNLAQGEKITITTADERLATGVYNSVAITQSNFTVDIGQNSMPVLQAVEVSVFVCAEFSGPDTVNLRFNMVDTLLASDSFQFSFDQTKPLTLQKSGSTYLDSELDIDLPASAEFEVTAIETSVENTISSNITIYHSDSGQPSSAIISICNI
ncbi:PKD domain-containing protein [Pseudoalteromonas sp. SG45-2]|uniref:PKD domain-containing protein n=1 Tax=Pseudoalteromonas sp. SG45-2 TaxID=2760956 RepID=UPI001603896C|nr:PKD domain-containing protein [Pseudoalteromonas sp. SG45-2]MBB1347694.1 PKD domain-containing protein [Pseudoalteromonas sp. SG45-2]